MMSDEVSLSFLVWHWHDLQTDIAHLRIIRTDTAAEVRLRDGAFLLRIAKDEQGQVERCFIRHIVSGSEAYVQGGAHLRTFVNDCILQQREPSSDNAPDTSAT